MLKHLTPDVAIVLAALLALFVFGMLIMCAGLRNPSEPEVRDTADTAAYIIFPQHPIALAMHDVLV